MPRATFSQIVNRSMSEVITRSLVTSLSTLFPIAALMIFGGDTLRDFGFALLVGVASGTYSSIFIAAPVLTEWKEREPVYKRRRQLVMEDHGGVVPPFSDVSLGTEDEDAAGARKARRGAVAPKATPRGGGRTRLGRAGQVGAGPPPDGAGGDGRGQGSDGQGSGDGGTTRPAGGRPNRRRGRR
jgi:SecD/SecF fusion protein